MGNKAITVTLITGASGGIGEEMARQSADAGENLLLVARREEQLRQLKRELEEKHSVSVDFLSLDLTETGAVDKVLEYVETENLVVDTLISNAGFGGQGYFHEIDWDRHAAMIQLNVTALTELSRRVLPGMVERGHGRLLHVASTAGFIPGPLQAVYYATKAYVVSFSQAVDEEVRDQGVTSTVLCPGPVDTGFASEAGLESSPMFDRASTPEQTARAGLRGMRMGKLVATEVPSMVFFLRRIVQHIPSRFLLRLVKRMQAVD
jgi:short-subunit dehydrogenase